MSWMLVDKGDEVNQEGRSNRKISISLLLDANSFNHSKYEFVFMSCVRYMGYFMYVIAIKLLCAPGRESMCLN